jgi:hypothetical protein
MGLDVHMERHRKSTSPQHFGGPSGCRLAVFESNDIENVATGSKRGNREGETPPLLFWMLRGRCTYIYHHLLSPRCKRSSTKLLPSSYKCLLVLPSPSKLSSKS